MNDEDLDFEDQIEICREKLLILKTPKGIPVRIAQYFIEHSAYWNHPSAGWVGAPKHSERIEYGHFGYELKFGGNYFLVGLAINRCVNTVSNLLDLFEDGDEYSYEELLRKLFLHVRGAVANNDGNEYRGYYPIEGNNMIFGTQLINVKDFVGIITATSEIAKMYKF